MDCCEEAMAMYGVVFPKPRRVAPPHMSIAPSTFHFHIRNDAESNNGPELLGLILRQGQNKASTSVSSPPPFSIGSPPCRSQNPVIQDVDFGVEKLTVIDEDEASSSQHERKQLGIKQAAPRL